MNIIRPSNAYCPGQLLHRVIPKTIWCALTRNKLPLQGGGKAEKSYIHARDLAEAINLVSEGAPFGEIYNVGPKNPTSIVEVVERTASALGLALEDICIITEDRLGQDSKYWLDSSKIESQLGWKQKINWDDGLSEMVHWGERYKGILMKMKPDYVMRA
jgi:dTDP-glucose 4,6-dehydratase